MQTSARPHSLIQSYEQTARVNEPGRTLWVKVQIALD
jgi:hypothetical protein